MESLICLFKGHIYEKISGALFNGLRCKRCGKLSTEGVKMKNHGIKFDALLIAVLITVIATFCVFEFVNIDSRLDNLETRIETVKTDMKEMKQDMKDIRNCLNSIDNYIGHNIPILKSDCVFRKE